MNLIEIAEMAKENKGLKFKKHRSAEGYYTFYPGNAGAPGMYETMNQATHDWDRFLTINYKNEGPRYVNISLHELLYDGWII